MAITVKVSEFGPIVDTLTYEYIVPKVTDNILGANVLAMRFLQNQKPATAWGTDVSGAFLGVPIKYQSSTSGGWYSGFDTFSTTQVSTRVLATYSPKQLYWTVGASGIQVGVNQGPKKILDLLSVEMQSCADDMASTFGTGLYSDGTGTSNKQLTGLQAAVNDGTDVATYAGLSRSTYTTWVSYEDDDAEAISLADLGAAINGATIGSDHPTLIVTTEAIWTTIEGLAMGTVTMNQPTPGLSRQYGALTRDGVRTGQGADVGYTALFMRGIPIVADEKCTSGRIYLLNEKHIGLARWAYPDFPGYQSKGNYNGFCWTGLKLPTNQDASVGQFLYYGQLVTDACRTHSYCYSKT